MVRKQLVAEQAYKSTSRDDHEDVQSREVGTPSAPTMRAPPGEQTTRLEQSSKTKTTVIHASLVITGPASAAPLKDHTVVIEDGTITKITPTSSLASSLKEHPSTTVPVLLPGLWVSNPFLRATSKL